jgi:hypothetical protein
MAADFASALAAALLTFSNSIVIGYNARWYICIGPLPPRDKGFFPFRIRVETVANW